MEGEKEELIECIKKLRIFASDCLSQIGKLAIQDHGNMNEAFLMSDRILKQNGFKFDSKGELKV